MKAAAHLSRMNKANKALGGSSSGQGAGQTLLSYILAPIHTSLPGGLRPPSPLLIFHSSSATITIVSSEIRFLCSSSIWPQTGSELKAKSRGLNFGEVLNIFFNKD